MIIEYAGISTRQKRRREEKPGYGKKKCIVDRGRVEGPQKSSARASAYGRIAGARREENRMARGGMRGRRWAFRGPAMITDSANP